MTVRARSSFRLVVWSRRRLWPIVATVVTMVAGMGYCILVTWTHHGIQFWTVPGDIWSAYRSAHFIGWGGYGGIYAAGTGLVTFPGILLLLAPVAMLTQALGLSESFPYAVPHPGAWLVLGPYEILLSSTALFACDALAERLGVSSARRFWLCAAEAVVLWNVDVVWGHPEDAVALALALYALTAAFDGRWARTGWLFGAAVATQPLVILMFPILLALGGRREWGRMIARTALPAAVLLVVPFVAHFHQTAHAVLDQPNFPIIDHVTPWTSWAPHLGGSGKGIVVAAGPGRVVAILLAAGIGWWVWRRRPDPHTVVAAVALALALRCFTESVMVPFYFWPPVAVGLVAAARSSWRRLAVAAVVGAGITVFSDFRVGPWWLWWSVVCGGVAIVVVVAWPNALASRNGTKNHSSSPSEMPEQLIEDGSVLTTPP